MDDPSASDSPWKGHDDASDDGSIFEIVGDLGNGEVSSLCAHCQHIMNCWSEGFNDCDFRFPHYQDISDLEASANGGCSLCAQFLRSVGEEEIQHGKEEMKELGKWRVETPGVSALTWNSYLHGTSKPAAEGERLHLDLPFLRAPDGDMEDDPEDTDSYDREIVRFMVDMVPNCLPGKHDLIP
jgi:hypothetical protein